MTKDKLRHLFAHFACDNANKYVNIYKFYAAVTYAILLLY